MSDRSKLRALGTTLAQLYDSIVRGGGSGPAREMGFPSSFTGADEQAVDEKGPHGLLLVIIVRSCCSAAASALPALRIGRPRAAILRLNAEPRPECEGSVLLQRGVPCL